MKRGLQIGLACFLLCVLHLVASGQTLRTVALSGQQAPGTSIGVNFDGVFSAPALNAAGQTAFFAYISGTGVGPTNHTGIWSEGSGSLELVARMGSQAPGTPTGVTFHNFGFNSLTFSFAEPPLLNSTGEVAFTNTVSGSGVDNTNNGGIWSGRAGDLDLVAREGDPAPGTSSGILFGNYLTRPALNDARQVAFQAVLTGGDVNSTNNYGIWSGSDNLDLVTRNGSPAPGTPAGVNFRSVSLSTLNATDQTAFSSSLSGSGVTGANDSGIWLGSAGNLELIAREGSQVPGAANGVNFGSLSAPVINAAGQTAFRGEMFGPGVFTTNNAGIWSEGSGNLSLVARSGDQAPGTPDGVLLSSFGNPLINAAGQTAFTAGLAFGGVNSTNNWGIWSDSSGQLELVARSGNQAPGTPDGVNFAQPDRQYPLVVNAAGQIAFQFSVTGPGVDFTNDQAIWATDQNGELQLVVREGDVIEVAPSVFRTIRTLVFGFANQFGAESTGNEDGRTSGFNDRGQLAFHATFVESGTGSGIFVSDLVAAPPTVPGDYNGNGIVDAPDYTVWRDTLGGTSNLAADGNGSSVIDAGDYNSWRARFGQSAGTGSEVIYRAVPESSTLVMILTIVSWCLWRHRSAYKVPTG